MTTSLRDFTDDTTEARELSRVAYLHIETTTHGASSYHARSTRFTYTVGIVIKTVIKSMLWSFGFVDHLPFAECIPQMCDIYQ